MLPIEIKEYGVIRKLNKAVYDLDDTSQNWYFSINFDLDRLVISNLSLTKPSLGDIIMRN